MLASFRKSPLDSNLMHCLYGSLIVPYDICIGLSMSFGRKLAFYNNFYKSGLFDDDSDNYPEYIQPSETSSGTDSEN